MTRPNRTLAAWLMPCALTTLLLASGCGGNDNGPAGTPTATKPPTATNTPAPTDTPAPPAIAGNYTGTVALANGQSGQVDLTVQANGDASGTLTVSDSNTVNFFATAGSTRLGRAAAIIATANLSGTVNPQTGEFSVHGNFTDNDGQPVQVDLSGILPFFPGGGSMTLSLNSAQYSGTISGSNPTATPTPTSNDTGPTSTPTPTATPTPTGGGANPTPTTGVVPPGISSAMLGTWSGSKVNQTTGVHESARIKIEVAGGQVQVTDLGGNVFVGGNQITMVVRSAEALSYNVGPPNPNVIVFTLSLLGGNTIEGLYTVTTVSFPPMSNGYALVDLHKES